MTFHRIFSSFGLPQNTILLEQQQKDGKLLQIFLDSTQRVQGAIYHSTGVQRAVVRGLPDQMQRPRGNLERLFFLMHRGEEIQVYPKLLGGSGSLPNYEAWMGDDVGSPDELLDFLRVFVGLAAIVNPGRLIALTLLGLDQLKNIIDSVTINQLKTQVGDIGNQAIDDRQKVVQLENFMKEKFPSILQKEEPVKEALSKKLEEEIGQLAPNLATIQNLIGFTALLFSFKDSTKAKRYALIGRGLWNLLSHGAKLKEGIQQGASLLALAHPATGVLLTGMQLLHAFFSKEGRDQKALDQLETRMIQLHAKSLVFIKQQNEELLRKIEILLGEGFQGILDRICSLEQNIDQLFAVVFQQLTSMRDLLERMYLRVDEGFRQQTTFRFREKRGVVLQLLGMNITESQTTEHTALFMAWAANLTKERIFTGDPSGDVYSFRVAVNEGKNLEDFFFGINWLTQFAGIPGTFANPLVWAEAVEVVLHIRLATLQYKSAFSSSLAILNFRNMVSVGASFLELIEKIQRCGKFSLLIQTYVKAIKRIQECPNFSISNPVVQNALQEIDEAYLLLQAYTFLAFPESRQRDSIFMGLLNGKGESHLFSRQELENKLIESTDCQEALKGLKILDKAIKQKLEQILTGQFAETLPLISGMLQKLALFWDDVYPKEPPLPGTKVENRPIPLLNVERLCAGDIFLSAEFGCLSEVIELLSRGTDVNIQEPGTRRTLLHIAAKQGDVALVKELLNRDAKILPDAQGHTPLDEAKDPAIIALLSAKMSLFDQLGVKELQEVWITGNPVSTSWPNLQIIGDKLIEYGTSPRFIRIYRVQDGKLLVENKNHHSEKKHGPFLLLHHHPNHFMIYYNLSQESIGSRKINFGTHDISSDEKWALGYEVYGASPHKNIWATKFISIDVAKNEKISEIPATGSFYIPSDPSKDDGRLKYISISAANEAQASIKLQTFNPHQTIRTIPIPPKYQHFEIHHERALVAYSKEIKVFDLLTGQCLLSLAYSPQEKYPTHFQGNFVAGPGGLWDIEKKERLHQFSSADLGYVQKTYYSRQGDFLLYFCSAVQGSIVELYDLNKRQFVGRFAEGCKVISAFVRGATLITHEKEILKFWKIQSKQLFYSFKIDSFLIDVDSKDTITLIDQLTKRIKAFRVT